MLRGTGVKGFSEFIQFADNMSPLGNADADALTISSTGGYTGITLRSDTNQGGAIYFSDATSGAGEYDGYITYAQSNQSMSFGTAGNGSPRMLIDSTGNVGIGTTNPTAGLHIEGTASPAIVYDMDFEGSLSSVSQSSSAGANTWGVSATLLAECNTTCAGTAAIITNAGSDEDDTLFMGHAPWY